MKTSFVSSRVRNCKSALVHLNAFVSKGNTIDLLIVQNHGGPHVISSHLNSHLLGMEKWKAEKWVGERKWKKGVPPQRLFFFFFLPRPPPN